MYKDIVLAGDSYRTNYRDGIDAYVKRLIDEGGKRREEFMPCEHFQEKIEEYRQKYIEMLGIDLICSDDTPEPILERVGEDNDAVIYRTTIYITKEIPQYGLLFVPHGIERAPLVIAQHGGGGTPELCSDMNGPNNYNRMVRRLLARKACVFAPQLLLWNCDPNVKLQPLHDIPHQRRSVDYNLKRFGISITALEIKGIMNAITYLSSLPFVDGESIGMTGISYGGYFTLHTMAADTRIKAGVSNAAFNDRNVYPWGDWTYPNCGNTFHDAEVAALCAPRKLYITVGKEDTLFDYKSAIPEAERAKKYFMACGHPDNFVFEAWEGGHTIPSSEECLDFMFSAWADARSPQR